MFEFNRKNIIRFAFFGAMAFWTIGVIGNHGLGKIRVHTRTVLIGEIGFISCWTIMAGTGLSVVIFHRRAYRRLQARLKRRLAVRRAELKSFRLALRKRRSPGDM
jgi:hypothetical protein